MDLTTRYLGLSLSSPLIASSSPLTGELDSLRLLEDAGAAAVVLPSLFEEQIDQEAEEAERLTGAGIDSVPEAASYFPASASFSAGPHRYLELIHQARAALAIPVIASLNGTSYSGWTAYAREIQQAGASALELNSFFVPVEDEVNGVAQDGRAVEQRHIDVLRAVKAAVTLPVSVKLGPYFSAVGDMAHRLEHAGAAGVVLFNRFYQPDIDLTTMRLRRDLDLSTPAELRLTLLWIGVLAGSLKGSLAAATGVDGAEQVVKYLLAGADVVMTASALLRHGPAHIGVLRQGLAAWLEARGVADIAEIRGSMSRRRLGDPQAFERANYISILKGWQSPPRRD